MSIGKLRAKIHLDDPDKLYYGSDSAVTGRVLLTFEPSRKAATGSNAELFGPLKVTATLRGQIKTNIFTNSGSSLGYNRARVPLFLCPTIISVDSFRAKANETHGVPFTVPFPDKVDLDLSKSWDENESVIAPSFELNLPPNLRIAHSGFSTKYEALIDYRLGVEVSMGGLKVDIEVPDKQNEPEIRFERARLAQPIRETPLSRTDSVSISNEQLLPEENRPSGVKKRLGSLSLSSYPTYAFDWTCVAPRHLYRGQPFTFEVSIRSQGRPVVIPEVSLTSLSAVIEAETTVTAEKRYFTHPIAVGHDVVARLFEGSSDDRPFCKANDWTKAITMRLPSDVLSSFTTCHITRTYTMKLKLAFKVTGKTRDFDLSYKVRVHPPLEDVDPSDAAISGSSSRRLDFDTLGAELPEYERPPEYEGQTETRPPAPPDYGGSRYG